MIHLPPYLVSTACLGLDPGHCGGDVIITGHNSAPDYTPTFSPPNIPPPHVPTIPNFAPSPTPPKKTPPPKKPPVIGPTEPDPFSPGGRYYPDTPTVDAPGVPPSMEEDLARAAEEAAILRETSPLGGDLGDLLFRFGALGDFANLLTYTTDAGLSGEDRLVAQQLGDLGFMNLYGVAPYGPNVASNPSEPDTDPYAEPIPYWPVFLPNPAGLPAPTPSLEPFVPTNIPFTDPPFIEAPARSPGPAPGVVTVPTAFPFPIGLPGVGPLPGVNPLPRLAPLPQPLPLPIPTPSPVPVPGLGFGTFPIPGVRPVPGPGVGHIGFPMPGTRGQPAPEALPQGGTKPDETDCQRSKGKGKDKKQKHRRTVCHRGTYVELASGLLKFKKETIPCR